MGQALQWVAVRGKPGDRVLAEFGVRPTGTKWELPDRAHPLAWAELPGGWTLVATSAGGNFDAPAGGRRLPCFVDGNGSADRFLAFLSAGCEAVAVFVEEHVMFSHAEGWRDGVRTWQVSHTPDEGPDHLEVEGAPPVDPTALARDLVADFARREGRSHHGPEAPRRTGLLGWFLDLIDVPNTPRGADGNEDHGVDLVFDVPVAVAKAATGFRHDEFDSETELLEPIA